MDWLEIQFYKDNINKYHKYFTEWVSALTESQIPGFEDQMIGISTQSKSQH
jgi:hypothetical protein